MIPMDPAADISTLVARCLAGEREAFVEIHQAHAAAVVAFFCRGGFDGSLADDFAQETFLRAWRSLKTFDAGKASFRTWLAAIARNVARREWQRRPVPERFDASFDEKLAGDVFAEPGDFAEDLAEAETLAGLNDCVDRLAQRDEAAATLIRLRYVEAMTTRGLAIRLNLPESTVRLKLAHAHGQLENCMKTKGFL